MKRLRFSDAMKRARELEVTGLAEGSIQVKIEDGRLLPASVVLDIHQVARLRDALIAETRASNHRV